MDEGYFKTVPLQEAKCQEDAHHYLSEMSLMYKTVKQISASVWSVERCLDRTNILSNTWCSTLFNCKS